MEGLNRACGAAVDTEGDVYAASADEGKVKVFSPASHDTPIAEVANANEPCGLAVDTRGTLYVVEKATGNVVKYTPNAYPLTASPSYSGPTTVVSSGNAKGIAVDPADDRLYVAEGSRVSVYQADGTQGQNALQQLIVRPGVTGGTFTLSFEAQATAPIPFNATPAQVQSALEALSTIGAGNVEVSESGFGERSYAISFTHALGSKAVSSLSVDSAGLSGDTAFLTGVGSMAGFAFSGHIGEGDLTNATAVAPFTYSTKRYLFVADSASDEVKVFTASEVSFQKPRIDQLKATDALTGFGFGAQGAAIAVNWADGHLFVYDATDGAVVEYELSGRQLVQIEPATVQDAAPSGLAVMPERSAMQRVEFLQSGSFKLSYEGVKTGSIASNASAATVQSALEALPGVGPGNVAVRRKSNEKTYVIGFTGALANRNVAKVVVDPSGLSGGGNFAVKTTRLPGAGPGRVYLGSGSGAAAKLLAFAGLAPASRPPLGEPLSRLLEKAQAVATDLRGNVYVAADGFIHVFKPDGTELLRLEGGQEKPLIEDPNKPLQDLAVDSAGNVYVLEQANKVAYYAPSAYPPNATTTYVRQGPIVTSADVSGNPLLSIAIDPGPGAGRDQLLLSAGLLLRRYASAEDGSTLLNPNLLGPASPGVGQSIDVDGRSGLIYMGVNPGRVFVFDASGASVGLIDGSGAPGGPFDPNPFLAVDQSSGHLLTFQPGDEAVREYDGAGGFVAEFGNFTPEGSSVQIAVDSACALHEPPLTGAACEAFDPANGNVYVAFDDPAPASFDVTAFGPLSYGEAPAVVTGSPSGLGAGEATLNGTVDPNGFDLSECSFEYLEASLYEENEEEGDPLFQGASTVECDPKADELGHGNSPLAVKATITLPDPEVAYRYRLVAAGKFGQSAGDAVLFGPPQVEALPALPVLYTEATLRARLDPSGLSTDYRFQYVDGAHFDAEGGFESAATRSTPAQTLAADTGESVVSATVTELEEGVEYHFRLIAENEAAAATGAGAELTTQLRRPAESCPNAAYRTGLSAQLPDCRAYELVTPAQTNGLIPEAPEPGSPVVGFSSWLTPQRGAGAGERLTYITFGTLPSFPQGTGRLDGYRAERADGDHPAAGWQSAFAGPSYVEAAPNLAEVSASRGTAADQLYAVWSIDPGPETFPETLARGIYLRTPAGFEPMAQGSLGTDLEAESHYLSAGGGHVIFSSEAHLEAGAPPEGNEALYDRAAGSSSADVLTVPPAGASEEEEDEFEASLLSKEQATFLGGNEDGTAVVFKAGAVLYVRQGSAATESISPRTARVGDTLSCAAGPLLGEGKRKFQWLRNTTPIPGAEGENDTQFDTDHDAVPADAGAALQCLVRHVHGTTGSVAVSAPVDILPLEASQEPKPPVRIAAPTPVSPGVGTIETCDPGSWENATELKYQWYVDGEAIAGATSPNYQIQSVDVPGTIQCVVIGSNAVATVARASALTPTSPAPADAALVATSQAAAKTTYAGVSEDGRYVFFAMGEGDSPARLFRFDTLTDSATEIAEKAIFLNVSADGSHALFSSEEALPGSGEDENGETAQAGALNLYAWDGASVRFAGLLSPEDFGSNAFADFVSLARWTQAIGPAGRRAIAPTRSTSDGSVFLFQSHARLTAYDNEGVGEIYRYQPGAEVGERLLCISCDPSGAPPSAPAQLVDVASGSSANQTTMIANVTDDGTKTYFQSPDRLVPEDANEALDVYEWKARGAGSCTRLGGCLALISSGQGEGDSYLYAMSADGRDVFFSTLEALVGSDVAGSPSFYDAREGGGIPEPTAGAGCQGDACQGEGSPPASLPGPASTGTGEPKLEPPRRKPRCAKGRRRVVRNGKARCLKRQRHVRHAQRGRGGAR